MEPGRPRSRRSAPTQHDGLQMPSRGACERARLSRDARFDGLFFTAVVTTGIYCRPVCPAPAPKPNNIKYLPTAALCEQEGFRPCQRCRPELSPAARVRGEDVLLDFAFDQVRQGVLAQHGLEELAARCECSVRTLTRRFAQRFGVTPTQMHHTQRLLLGKKLLSETALPVTQVAFAAGFSSLRRFNDAFVRAYRLSPSSLRRQRKRPSTGVSLQLHYRPPYAWETMIAWLQIRAVPGVELVQDNSFYRVWDLGSGQGTAWLRLRPSQRSEHALQLDLHDVSCEHIAPILQRVRRMFDLDAHPKAIAKALSAHPHLRPWVNANPGLRIPGAWSGYEAAVRAVVGQQISVKAASTIMERIVQRCGRQLDSAAHPQLDRVFPAPQELLDADLSGIGLTAKRLETLRGVAQGLIEGRLDFVAHQGLDAWLASWCEQPGIGPWTAAYLALRALGEPDAFPHADLVLRKRLSLDPSTPLTPSQTKAMAEAWRPWRGYAAFHTWCAPDVLEE